MSDNILRPEGQELIHYLNEGYKICNECGAIMKLKEPYTFVCPGCGWEIDGMEYEYDDGDPEPKEWAPNMIDMFGEDIPGAELRSPECCMACGGPYPDCRISCKIFDE